MALLVQAVPILADFLQSIDARNDARIASLRADLQAIEKRQTGQLQALLSAGLTLRLEAESPGLLRLQPTTAVATEAQRPRTLSSTIDPSGLILPAQEQPVQEQPPQHSMCRTTKTVEDLWREWTVGLRGQPAITVLDSRWGSRWRAGRQSELQWYSLRSEIIKEIRRIARVQQTSEASS